MLQDQEVPFGYIIDIAVKWSHVPRASGYDTAAVYDQEKLRVPVDCLAVWLVIRTTGLSIFTDIDVATRPIYSKSSTCGGKDSIIPR